MKKILLSLTAMIFAGGSMIAAHAATCTSTYEKDGKKVEIQVEGDECTIDFNTGICSCT